MNWFVCVILAIVATILALILWPFAKLAKFVHWLITRDLKEKA